MNVALAPRRRSHSLLGAILHAWLPIASAVAVASCGSVGDKTHPDATGGGGATTGGGTGGGGGGGGAPSDAAVDRGGSAGDAPSDTGGDVASTGCPALLGYWPADDDASDKIGNNPGTVQDGVTFARGQVGDAFVFDGTNSVIVMRAPGVSAIGNWTYSFWINVVSYPNGDNTYFFDRNSASAPLVDLKASGNHFQFLIRYDDSTGLGGPIGGTITTGSWTHIALVRDTAGHQFYLYVNGQNVGSTTDTGGSLTPPPFKVGRHFNSPTGGFSGLIDELEIYDGALTAAQILSLAQNGPCR